MLTLTQIKLLFSKAWIKLGDHLKPAKTSNQAYDVLFFQQGC